VTFTARGRQTMTTSTPGRAGSVSEPADRWRPPSVPERPIISVKNTFTAPFGDTRPDPEIYLKRRNQQHRGTVAMPAPAVVIVGARIEAQTVDIRTDGDFIQQSSGVSHQGGAPRAHYNTFARNFENATAPTSSGPIVQYDLGRQFQQQPAGIRRRDPDLPNPPSSPATTSSSRPRS